MASTCSCEIEDCGCDRVAAILSDVAPTLVFFLGMYLFDVLNGIDESSRCLLVWIIIGCLTFCQTVAIINNGDIYSLLRKKKHKNSSGTGGYHFRDLRQGKDAWLESTAPIRYQFISRSYGISSRKASNSYGEGGAKEYTECRTKNNMQNIICERQFRMPPRISLFGSESDTSEISGSEPEMTQEESNQWLQRYYSKVIVYPTEAPLQGGDFYHSILIPRLQPDVTSVWATFENLGTVQLERVSNNALYGTVPGPASEQETYQIKTNVPKDTGYSGDVDISSSESSLSLSDFEPEDDISTTLIPKEVVTRGPVAMEVYSNALAEGKTLVKRVPLMLIGQVEAGKTSLKKSLTGICFNPDEESTVGIDVDPSHFKLTKEIRKVGQKDQEANSVMAISFEQQAARFMANKLKERGKYSEKKRAPVTSEKSYDSMSFEPAIAVMPTVREAPLMISEPPKSPDRIQTSEHSAGSTPTSEDSGGPIPDGITAFTPPEQEFEEIASLAETLLRDGGLENGDVYSMLWDFAGQSVYYVTHVLFLTGRAIYFLVYDLSQNPHDRAKPLVKQGVYNKVSDMSSLKTNLDYLDLWMTSVASQACQGEDDSGPKSEVLPKKLPAVFLVCTHADKPHGGRDPREMASEIFGCLKKKSYGAHLYDVFCVDNTKSGSESECPEVMRLREEVLAVSNELPYINKSIPIKWLKYEKALRMMLELGYKWISLDKAKHIASKVCRISKDDEVLTSLNFLHDLRILIHFDDTPELNQLVILDPQWLIDVFKKVITVKPRHEWKEKKFEDLWCKLEGEGILDEDLVNHVWSDLNNKKDTLEGLIAIMEKFGLLCPCPSSDDLGSKQYLVPSMLKSPPPEAIIKLAASAQVPSLFVKFESGQVPIGLFPRLVVQFYQWRKEEFWRPGNSKFYQNFARLFISGDKDCSVILRCHSSSIEILYHSIGYNTACFTFTHAVRRQMGLILECMRNQLCWLKDMKYQMSIICPVCCEGNAAVHCEIHDVQSCKQEECLHFWSESELCGSKKSISCTKYSFAVDTIVDAKVGALWFTSPVEQVANGKQDERLSSSYAANEENALALLGGHQVLESILAESYDPKEVVNRLSENLEQLSLTEPDPNAKKLVRCLAMKAKCSNRLDVVEYLRETTPAGTTGPLLPESLQVQRIPLEQRRKLTISLSGGDEWKLVAERLGLTPEEIRFLDKRILNPADAMLGHVATLRSKTVGDLYDLLVDCELPVMADIL